MARIEAIFSHVLDAIFPRHCVQCAQEGSLFCTSCSDGRVFDTPSIQLFAKGGLNGLLSSFYYKDPVIRKLIKAWKYDFDISAWKHLQVYVDRQNSALTQLCDEKKFDAIVPVPLHTKRYCERGFDQAGEISRFLSEQLRVPNMDLLARTRRTGYQSERSYEDRKGHMLRNPFIVKGSLKGYQKVLLVDDVWTTGSTGVAAANTLAQQGIDVWMYTLAQG